ncbi:unnamed protein product [Cochlearia groenlandica]
MLQLLALRVSWVVPVSPLTSLATPATVRDVDAIVLVARADVYVLSGYCLCGPSWSSVWPTPGSSVLWITQLGMYPLAWYPLLPLWLPWLASLVPSKLFTIWGRIDRICLTQGATQDERVTSKEKDIKYAIRACDILKQQKERTTQPYGTEAALIPDDRIPLGGTLLRTRLSKELWRMNGVGGYGGGLQVKNEAADDGEKREDGI